MLLSCLRGSEAACRWQQECPRHGATVPVEEESPFPEQEPPPPFPPSCHSGQGDNRHSRISAPLNVQLFLH